MGQSKSKQKTASLTNAAASSSSSSLPLSPTNHQKHYTYEVFLSFRGEDTRCNFTDHLYTALRDRGIETFRDADELRRGEVIEPALLKALEESRVSIIVFSRNYASSRWCLDELVNILECCRKFRGREVIPVFYKVDPSHVRHQTGAFGDAFATLDQDKYKDRVDKWRKALSDAANLSGWTYEQDRSEAEFVKKIVGHLSARAVNHSYDLVVAEHPIGLESCRQDVSRLLDVEKNNMVGIWGPGGIGKTTIAKDMFNSIGHEFDYRCFLADVRSNGLAQLQERLLSQILGDKTLEVSSLDQGVSLIRTKMLDKKILLILDDVSHHSQLKNLVPSSDCFGPGSTILITTRDKRCLTAHEVNKVHEVKILDDNQALKLFSWYAFKSNEPPHAYLKLARRAVRYAQGLPLALTVLGSHLFKRSIEEWEAILDSCKGGPQADIQKVLKLSYDALEKDFQELFLDIACFFKGKHAAHVKQILEACYDHNTVVIGIALLREKALIRIERDDHISMHDLIEEMGKGIVYHESPGEAGGRSRVWSKEDANDVLTFNTGTNEVKGIQVPRSSTISLNAKSFSGMEKLRYISMSSMVTYESVFGDIDYLSNQLRWLDWPTCPLQSFPSNFHAKKLVNFDISGSRRITRLWEENKNFPRLTCMNLSGCTSLKELPDFSGFPNLKELNLSQCTSLVEVPHSIRFLHNLVTLKVVNCSNLIMFPRKINLRSVETISIGYCKLEEFSEFGEEMGSLRRLDLLGTCIKELHPSITRLIGLEVLKLQNCKNLTFLPYNIYELHSLKSLEAIGCSKLATFPKIPVKWDSLRELCLRGSDIRELNESIRNLIGLELLDLTECKNLTALPCSIYELQNLGLLDLDECSKLVRFPINVKILNGGGCSLSLPKLRRFSIAGCSLLSDCDFLMTLDCWETLERLDLSRNNFVSLPACLTKFVKLETLGLKGCWRLRGIPELPSSVVGLYLDLLRRLYLEDSDIRELDKSIENLNGLEELDLSGCENLTTLPCNIYGLHDLKTLDASGCSKLATFPKISVKMDSLRLLSLKGSDIRELDESIGNLIRLEYLDLTDCENLTTLPCSIYGLQNLWFLDLGECSKLVRFPTNTKILNVDGCSLSLPKLGVFSIAGCSSLSDCDFLMTLDCWETLQWLNLSRNNFVSLPACLTKFVKLRDLDLSDCKRLRGIPELPPNVKTKTWGCESLEERSSTLTDPGAVIEAASPSIEEPTPSSGLSLPSEAPKRHRTAAGAQASMVHSAHEMAISPIPMIPDLQTHHFGWHGWRSYLLSANDDYQEQQEHVSITELVRNFNTTRNQLSC